MRSRYRFVAILSTAGALTVTMATVAGARIAAAPPVGPLPSGPTSTTQTRVGQLVAFALPHRPSGRVWRIARAIDSGVLVQVGEADVGANVVLVFKAKGKGTATVSFGLTRGETAKAYEARRFTVKVQ
jgi:hypothetical protein